MDDLADNLIVDSHKRTIIHIDMDYFYAQVEEIRNPTLRSSPLGIQQKNMVVTSNYLARDFGIKKLMSVPEALKLCPQLNLVKGEDLTNYRQMSAKISEILHKYTPLIEKLGLDENYLDVTDIVNQRLNEQKIESQLFNTYGNIYPEDTNLESCTCGCAQRLAIGTHIAKEIRDDLLRNLRITCSAGIAHNKLLSKLVGSMNKPNNQTVLCPLSASSFMRNLECLQKITGIGQKTEAMLRETYINNVVDLQNCDFDIIKKKFGYETACKLKELSFGRDNGPVRTSGKPKTIGLEDSCRPISVRRDVEERFKLLLMRLMNQVSDDGRIPVAIKIILRKYDAKKKTSHRETKQANILPSLFKQVHKGQIMMADGAQDKILKIIMRLFDRIIDMAKPFNITLLGLAFSKFQERKCGSSSIANFLIKKTDLEVQSVTSLTSEGVILNNNERGDDYYRRRTTASPIPMLVDLEPPSDVSDFSEPEIEPSPKKTRLGLLVAKRRCLSSSDVSDIASPSKLRVAELRLNSRDSEREGSSPTTTIIPYTTCKVAHSDNTSNISRTSTDVPLKSTSTALSGNLANIPCPAGVDPTVFNALPFDVQTELISSWRTSITAAASTTNHAAGNPGNTLHRYFIRNK